MVSWDSEGVLADVILSSETVAESVLTPDGSALTS